MPSKREKKRQAARRAGQKRINEVRREQRQEVRALAEEAMAAVDLVRASIGDPSVGPEAFAGRLGTLLDDERCGPISAKPRVAWPSVLLGSDDVDPPRLCQLADAVVAGRPDDRAAAWWAAGLYQAAGVHDRAETLASGALDASPEPDHEGARIVHQLRLSSGRVAAAAELAFSLCEADPEDEEAQALLARSLARIVDREPGAENQPCGCGSGTPLASCCGPAEAAALARFGDRSRLDRTWEALDAFVTADPELAAWRAGHAAQLLGPRPLDDALATITGADRVGPPLERMALEQSSLSGPAGEHDSLFGRFADDPSTPADLAALARSWGQVAWGYWQIPDPVANPGVWVTNLVTHETWYAAVSPAVLAGAGRWSVLAAGLVSDAGVWRPTDTCWLLDPDEGDRAAEITSAAADNVAAELAQEQGLKNTPRLRRRRPCLDDPPPHGVLAAYEDPVGPVTAHFYHTIAAVSSVAVVGSLCSERSGPPRITNTDKEPLELLRAVTPVDDAAGLRARLLARPEFEADPEDTRIVWNGREMTALEAETNEAELRATLGAGELVEGPRRWMRGVLDLEEDRLTIEVNSRARLAAITKILARLGVAEPLVERRVDPALDLGSLAGWRPLLAAGSPEAEEAWRARWLDESVPALGGLTPRKAAGGEKTAVTLERLLRRFEHAADLAEAAGERPLDVDALRMTLGSGGRPFER